jgi:hypothetical protein
MNYYTSILVFFTILFILILLIVYYLFSSKNTKIKSKYNACPDYWKFDNSTGYCDPLGNSFINFTDFTSTTPSSTEISSFDKQGNVIKGTKGATTGTSNSHTINSSLYEINTNNIYIIKTKDFSTKLVSLYFVFKCPTIIPSGSLAALMTSCDSKPDLTFNKYSYFIYIGADYKIYIETYNNPNTITYISDTAIVEINKSYVLNIILKDSYSNSESPTVFCNNTQYTINFYSVVKPDNTSDSTQIASKFDLLNTTIVFNQGRASGNFSSVDPSIINIPLGQFVQFNYNISLTDLLSTNDLLNNTSFLGNKWDINNASNNNINPSGLLNLKKGLIDFNDPTWYSKYNTENIECSWQKWCNTNKIEWSGIKNGTFC